MDDKFKFPDLFDGIDADGDPTAQGIVQCLRMLADEAAALGLGRTLAALRTAITVCASEGETADGEDAAGDAADPALALPPAGTRLH